MPCFSHPNQPWKPPSNSLVSVCVHPEWPAYSNQLHLSGNKFRVERMYFPLHLLIEWFEQARATTHYYYGLAQAYAHFAGQVPRFLRHTRMQSCGVTFPSKAEPDTVLLFAFDCWLISIHYYPSKFSDTVLA